MANYQIKPARILGFWHPRLGVLATSAIAGEPNIAAIHQEDYTSLVMMVSEFSEKCLQYAQKNLATVEHFQVQMGGLNLQIAKINTVNEYLRKMEEATTNRLVQSEISLDAEKRRVCALAKGLGRLANQYQDTPGLVVEMDKLLKEVGI